MKRVMMMMFIGTETLVTQLVPTSPAIGLPVMMTGNWMYVHVICFRFCLTGDCAFVV